MADAEKRRERISLLRSLGFTHQQAFRLANAKGETILGVMRQQKEDIESVPRNERTPQQREILKSYRGVPLRDNSRILTRSEKREQWSHWSSGGGHFPAHAQAQIRAYNENAGNDPFDEFGFQAYYFDYVEEYDDVDDGDFYEESARR